MPRKSKATLGRLTEAQQQAVFEMIERTNLAQASRNLRVEFDIELSENSISKWADKMRFQKHLAARVELILRARNSADELVHKIGDGESIDKANLVLLGQTFMDAQLSGDAAAIEQFGGIYAAVKNAQIKADRAETADRALDLLQLKINDDREKFRVSLMKKVEIGMEELLKEIKGNPKALAAFQAMKEALTVRDDIKA